ncbi:MAG: hypothetical protein D3926_21485 [Desulfobacteraceae bacterium]|nr:MAG: hypothetical protein D3926_21485 [Desulfobacteraceae bacterium]
MLDSVNIKAKSCCSKEKERLVRELYECDYETTSPEERHLCYRWAAKKSGHRAKQCMISG